MSALESTNGPRWGGLRTLLRWIAADHGELPEPARPEAIDWARIVNGPSQGVTSVAVSNGTPSAAAGLNGLATQASGGNCACTANCYVESLAASGTTAVTITATRRLYNCNCNCRC